MKYTLPAGLAVTLAAICLAALPVAAQQQATPSPTGSWGFKSDPMGANCTLAGDMTITQTSAKTYRCAFKAVWACELRLPRAVHTEQSCIATQAGDQVTITSKMEKVSKVQPVEMMEEMKRLYAADHFSVKLNTRGDEMDGIFRSYGSAKVKFRRHLDLIG